MSRTKKLPPLKAGTLAALGGVTHGRNFSEGFAVAATRAKDANPDLASVVGESYWLRRLGQTEQADKSLAEFSIVAVTALEHRDSAFFEQVAYITSNLEKMDGNDRDARRMCSDFLVWQCHGIVKLGRMIGAVDENQTTAIREQVNERLRALGQGFGEMDASEVIVALGRLGLD